MHRAYRDVAYQAATRPPSALRSARPHHTARRAARGSSRAAAASRAAPGAPPPAARPPSPAARVPVRSRGGRRCARAAHPAARTSSATRWSAGLHGIG
eukprot:scaffold6064_cov64-Phaeocystis_antarctica.AAC.1